MSWSSFRWKQPVKSIDVAELWAAGEAIDEGKILARALAAVHGTHIPLIMALNSKDIFTLLSTLRNSIDNFMRSDVNLIRYDFETKSISRSYGFLEWRI